MQRIAAAGVAQDVPEPYLHAAGYIRNYSGDKRVVWFAADEAGERVSPAIVAHNTASPGETSLVIHPSASYSRETGNLAAGTEILVENAGGKDPLISSSLDLPLYLASAAVDAVRVLDDMRLSWDTGFYGYLLRAGSFFAGITALWVLVFATGWRLLNMLLALTGFRLIFAFYPYTLTGLLYDPVRRLLPGSIDNSLVSPLLLVSVSALIVLAGAVVLLRRLLSRRPKEAYND